MKVLFTPNLTLMTCSLVFCQGAVLQMQYTSSDKCKKNTLLGKRKSLCFCQPQKSLWVPRFILWWAMRKMGIDEWIVRLVGIMYVGENSRVRVNCCFSERFEVTVGVHQGSVLSPLLLTIVMEALSCECHIGCSSELLYTDDLVIMSDNLEGLKILLQAWRTSLETWGLRINFGKTKILGSSSKAQKPTRNVK